MVEERAWDHRHAVATVHNAFHALLVEADQLLNTFGNQINTDDMKSPRGEAAGGCERGMPSGRARSCLHWQRSRDVVEKKKNKTCLQVRSPFGSSSQGQEQSERDAITTLTPVQ